MLELNIVPNRYANGREIALKIAFFGPAGAGKGSALAALHRALRPETRGQIVSVTTGSDRTLFFDFFPMPTPRLRSSGLRVQIYTTTGEVNSDSTRRALLEDVKGVIFLADSQRERELDNALALEHLRESLGALGLRLDALPHVFAWNKRDLSPLLSAEELSGRLNRDRQPAFETVATTGRGLFEALKALTSQVLGELPQRRPSAAGAAGSPVRSLVDNRGAAAAPAIDNRASSAVPSLDGLAAPSGVVSCVEVEQVRGESRGADAALAIPVARTTPRSRFVARDEVTPSRPRRAEAALLTAQPTAILPGREERTSLRTPPLSAQPTAVRTPVPETPRARESLAPRAPAAMRTPLPLTMPSLETLTEAGASRTRSPESAPRRPTFLQPLAPERTETTLQALREPRLSLLLPVGPLREQVLEIEQELSTGQCAQAVRRARAAFLGLTEAEAEREPDEGAAWRALSLGMPVDRYLRFREAARSADAGTASQEDGIYALFFLIDAILRS